MALRVTASRLLMPMWRWLPALQYVATVRHRPPLHVFVLFPAHKGMITAFVSRRGVYNGNHRCSFR